METLSFNLFVESDLSNLHAVGLVKVAPHGVDDVDVVHLVALVIKQILCCKIENIYYLNLKFFHLFGKMFELNQHKHKTTINYKNQNSTSNERFNPICFCKNNFKKQQNLKADEGFFLNYKTGSHTTLHKPQKIISMFIIEWKVELILLFSNNISNKIISWNFY